MLASVEKTNDGFRAVYERTYNHAPQEVWAYLTDNDKLSKWFSELRVAELRKGGLLTFDMGDGTFEEMNILDYEEGSVLEYTWGEDIVRFELSPSGEGTRLLLIEKISALTPHTPKDLAGWHVCLDVVAALLDGREMPDHKTMWEKEFVEYSELTDKLLQI
ncbi:SRPBCC family protein [Paenibacillus sp. LHD-117]|uniref:SRPBCC family protein n=1 Tax=Paenibacillus sp. LHD-117 TaxID=3071412 RepID=UPI0027E151C2|nr:SRPBCC family protein [Paenibacillus sp. LHD-117]MDQ6419445.1 SRPBCC family protein [Paenibacillus sp. LHD-117]